MLEEEDVMDMESEATSSESESDDHASTSDDDSSSSSSSEDSDCEEEEDEEDLKRRLPTILQHRRHSTTPARSSPLIQVISSSDLAGSEPDSELELAEDDQPLR
jgi:hypothetical protein